MKAHSSIMFPTVSGSEPSCEPQMYQPTINVQKHAAPAKATAHRAARLPRYQLLTIPG
jgi:hypothetical protein